MLTVPSTAGLWQPALSTNESDRPLNEDNGLVWYCPTPKKRTTAEKK